MAVTTALALGAAAMGVGGAMSAAAEQKAAAEAAGMSQFDGFNVQGAGGSVQFGPNNQVGVTADAQTRMFQQGFGDLFSQIQSGQAGNQGFINMANQIGNNMGGFFDQAGQAGNPNSAVNAANQFGLFSAQNAQFGQMAGQNALNTANMFGQAQGGRNEGLAMGAFGRANDAFGNSNFDTNVADMIARQRAFARPGEERAVNDKFQNLFSRGALSSTGGERQLGELALSQELADIQRVELGTQFGNQLTQQNRMFGMQNLQQGQGFRAQDDAFNAQRAQMFGGFGQNLLGFGQNAGQQGMGAMFAGNNLVNSRGQQRLQNAQGIFGFGQQAQNQNFQQQLGMFGANSQINSDMRNLIALGGNLGQMQASAGANAGNFLMDGAGSPFGSFMSGAGEGLLGGSV